MSSVPEMNFYDYLGLSVTASKKEIGKTINRLVRENHPDLYPNDPIKAEITSNALWAREWLESDSKRDVYDAHHRFNENRKSRKSGATQTKTSGERNQKSRPSPARSAGQRHTYRRRGRDVHLTVDLTFEEAFAGCVKNIDGNSLEILPRMRDGEELKYEGYGEMSPDDGHSGDLILTVAVKSSPIFDYYRDTDDLCIVIPISELESIFGASVKIRDFKGESQTIRIPPRTNNGKSWKLENSKFSSTKTSLPFSVYVSIQVIRLETSQVTNLSEAAKHGLGLLNFELYRQGLRDKSLFPD